MNNTHSIESVEKSTVNFDVLPNFNLWSKRLTILLNFQIGQRRTPPQIEPNKLYQLPQPELVDLVQLHMQENTALRTENAELFNVRDQLLRDQELLSRENERLLKKLEDVNSWVENSISLKVCVEQIN